MISINDLLGEVVKQYPLVLDLLNAQGFKGLDNKFVFKQLSDKTIGEIAATNNKNGELLVTLINEYLNEQNIDVTLQTNSNSDSDLKVLGLLPCPVRLPLLEGFDALNSRQQIKYDLKAASEGLDWLKESVVNAKDETELADMYISAGFDLFFEDDLMKKYKDQKVFDDYNKNLVYNKDFNNENITLKDPNNDYAMIGVVPAVFLVNTEILGDRPIPKTWEDLFDPMYERSISLPVSDFDLFNAIMIHLYKEFGKDSITRLGKQLIKSMHPSEMVKSDRGKREKPAISIMPYFFTKMALPGSVLQAVWPSDGAIISPIFMLSKASKEQELKEVYEFFLSKEVGEILSHKGLFPSTNNEVDNKLKDNTFKWIGWDYINNNDIGSILKECMELFERGLE